MNTEEKKLENIAKYLSDNMRSEEREDLFAWVEADTDNKDLFEDALEIWEMTESPAESVHINTDSAWSKMEQRLETKRVPNEASASHTLEVVSKNRFLLRIAAAALIVLTAGLWYMNSRIDKTLDSAIVTTQASEKTTIDLPDGSKVWLNGNSELKYEKKFEKRIVSLTGEAFFEVAKKEGHTFEIYAGESKTTVLGTSFNVRAYPEEPFVEIAVTTGKVHFASEIDKGSETVLVKKEHAVYSKTTEQVQKKKGEQANAAGWKNRTLYLGEAKMEQAVEALERYFSIDIEIENKAILNCNWGNTMKTLSNPDLKTLIEQINFANPYKFKEVAPNKYKLSGDGC